ncbi:TatD family [Hyaloraphidium curvatum]|nr:TatD family [Hyaloraphidium curvatum]
MCPTDASDASSSSSSSDASIPPSFPPELLAILADAHCHVHDAVDLIPRISRLCRTGRLLIMGVDPGDWKDVELAWELNNRPESGAGGDGLPDVASLRLQPGAEPSGRIVPAFGVHPWYAFCAGMKAGGDALEDVFELAEPGEEIDMDAENRRSAKELLQQDLVPLERWTEDLTALLRKYPTAIVGEIGLDKNATVRGTEGLRVRPEHQLAVAKRQLEIAAEMKRPVSVHLVNRSGWFLDIMRAFVVSADDLPKPAGGEGPQDDGDKAGKKGKRKKEKSEERPTNTMKAFKKPLKLANPVWTGPPAVCLHSYSASTAFIDQLRSLPGDAGRRFYFSYSIVINSRSPSFEERIARTPDDRLLIESDYDSPLMVDEMMARMCEVVARVKGWTVEEAARRTRENLERFLEVK